MSSDNPYAPSTTYNPIQPEIQQGLPLASQGQRFLTTIIDNVALFVINYGVGFVFGFIAVLLLQNNINQQTLAALNLISSLIGMAVAVSYYILFEATTGMTLGKMIVGTKVVNANGGKASFGQIVGRSFCRLIPFEAFSFFGNKGFPIGWHDSIPGTRVIKTR